MSAAAEQSFANRNRCILISVSTLVNALGGVGGWFAFSLSIIYPGTIAVCFAKLLFGADEMRSRLSLRADAEVELWSGSRKGCHCFVIIFRLDCNPW